MVALAAVIAKLNRIFAAAATTQGQGARPKRAAAPAHAAAPEDDVNLNRSGHLPTLRAVEEAIAEPEAGPRVVGRYSAGGVAICHLFRRRHRGGDRGGRHALRLDG